MGGVHAGGQWVAKQVVSFVVEYMAKREEINDVAKKRRSAKLKKKIDTHHIPEKVPGV